MSEPLKQYKLDNVCVFEYKFDSLNSFLNYIQKMPVNRDIFYKCSSEKDDFSFTKTKSLDEAINLCMYGSDENFEKFLKLKNDVSSHLLNPNEIYTVYKDVVGFVPSVSDFLAGSPFNMLNRKKSVYNNIINIYFQLNYTSSTTTSQIYNRGAITLSIIDALEKAGYAVNLIPFSLSYEKDEIFIAYFDLKKTYNYLNEKIAFFPLCHPSFSRRLIFRLKEVTPFKEDWIDSYGKVLSDIRSVEKYIKPEENSIIIYSPNELNISGQDIYNDLENMLRAIEFDKYVKRSS